MSGRTWSIGSRWLRWDPHLHAPGTLRNNQFGSDWDGYISRIENARPSVSALGITDYFSMRAYKEVLQRRSAGALRGIPLVFANIELRLTIETRDRQGINLHLLVCPDDPEHIERVEAKLNMLRFEYRGEWFECNDHSLRRLGRKHKGTAALPDEAALQEGVNQFKVETSALRDIFREDAWIRSNVLVGVAAGADGLAGIAKDASFHAQREELGRFAHVVFSGQASDRRYWLGHHPDFAANGQTPKPCLHGSDAHSLDAVLEPAQQRRCWIRGEPTFDALRQALVEPERRTFVGESPPEGPSSADVVRMVRLKGAGWVEPLEIELNTGLVTIIGAKGSGKTALADLIAYGAEADESDPGPASFIAKAGDLLRGLEVELEWGDGFRHSSEVPRRRWGSEQPRVRYLSQQFVERLCSQSGLAESLVEEIERVVFNAMPDEERMECSSFSELREVILRGPSAACDGQREAIREATKKIAEETALMKEVAALKGKALEAERGRKALEEELRKLPMKVSEEKVKAHEAAASKLQNLKNAIAAEERRSREIEEVIADVRRQISRAEMVASALMGRYPDLLETALWQRLTLSVNERAIEDAAHLARQSRDRVVHLRERGQPTNGTPQAEGLTQLNELCEKLEKELGLDAAKAKRRIQLLKDLDTAKTKEAKQRKELLHAEKATERRKELHVYRNEQYEHVFQALLEEETALKRLYGPLSTQIANDARLSKLSVFVQRTVDLKAWAERGESLLDLRRPPFNRRGLLEERAREELFGAWRSGSPSDVNSAMRSFIEKYGNEAFEALAHGFTPLEFGEWLFSTEHIRVQYGIQYEGVDLAHLSPGTRGVVLLTLYLALDEWDARPLIIDQPEENLDPRSVYADLVPFFRDAAKKRQIVMVTHNANLVVNTDSDQVIVAEANRTSPTELPHISYVSGGLEDAEIRAHVCRLLEGGDEAFRRRGQRYGVSHS
jgi:hypothetical protein